MPGGRPKGSGTNYDKKYAALLIEYFEKAAGQETRKLETYTIQERHEERIVDPGKNQEDKSQKKADKGKIKRKGYLKTEVRRICAELPTIEGFANSIQIPSSTVRGWAGSDTEGRPLHPEFAVAYARAKDIQFQLLVDRGLTRQYDPQAFQFVAKNITDMKDTKVLAGDDNAPPIAARLILVDAGAEEEK